MQELVRAALPCGCRGPRPHARVCCAPPQTCASPCSSSGNSWGRARARGACCSRGRRGSRRGPTGSRSAGGRGASSKGAVTPASRPLPAAALPGAAWQVARCGGGGRQASKSQSTHCQLQRPAHRRLRWRWRWWAAGAGAGSGRPWPSPTRPPLHAGRAAAEQVVAGSLWGCGGLTAEGGARVRVDVRACVHRGVPACRGARQRRRSERSGCLGPSGLLQGVSSAQQALHAT
jgi:hypothetical protein